MRLREEHMRQGDLAKAERDLNEALRLQRNAHPEEPDHIPALNNLAVLRLKQHQFEAAAAGFERVIQITEAQQSRQPTYRLALELSAAKKNLETCQRLQRLAAVEAKEEKEYNADTSAAAKGLNDNARGIDRFGYVAYATALVKMLKRAEPPLCVGLYARWGGGKSFFLFLVLSIFDPKAKQHPISKMVVQSFEEGYGEEAVVEEEEEMGYMECMISCARLVSAHVCNVLLPTKPYWLSTLGSILFDLLTWQSTDGAHDEEEQSLLGKSSNRKIERHRTASQRIYCCLLCLPLGLVYIHHRWCSWCSAKPRLRVGSVAPLRFSEPATTAKSAAKPKRTDYVFVHFNAWEYASSDELWTGLVRNLYAKVEMRSTQPPRKQRGHHATA